MKDTLFPQKPLLKIVWCNLRQKERANLKRADSNELMAILAKLGWVRRPKKDPIPLYGQQYIYDPKINPEKILGHQDLLGEG